MVAHLHPEYARWVAAGASEADALAAADVTRMCCRRMFLGHTDLTRSCLQYPNVDRELDGGGTILRREARMERTVACE